MKNIELIAIDDKPIKRRVFMKDYSGPERRKKIRRVHSTEDTVIIVLAGAWLALMLFYVG